MFFSPWFEYMSRYWDAICHLWWDIPLIITTKNSLFSYLVIPGTWWHMSGALQCSVQTVLVWWILRILHLHQSSETELKLFGYSEEGLKHFCSLLRLIIQWLLTRTILCDFLQPTNKWQYLRQYFFLSTSTASLGQSTRLLFRLNSSLRLVLLHEDLVSLIHSVCHWIS